MPEMVKVKVVEPRPEGNPYLPADAEGEVLADVATSLAASGLVEIVDNTPTAAPAKKSKE